MKKLGFYSGILLLLLGIVSCEKDDICPQTTPTTPSIFIRFFDRLDETRANATGILKCYELGNEKQIIRTGSEIKLPLRLDRNETVWVLELTSTDDQGIEVTRTDTLTFKYGIETTYVSKACGYKNTFTLADNSIGNENPKLNEDGQGTWINRFQLMTTDISNETDEHIKIFY